MMHLHRDHMQVLQGNVYWELLRFFRLLTDSFYVSDPSKDKYKREYKFSSYHAENTLLDLQNIKLRVANKSVFYDIIYDT